MFFLIVAIVLALIAIFCAWAFIVTNKTRECPRLIVALHFFNAGVNAVSSIAFFVFWYMWPETRL